MKTLAQQSAICVIVLSCFMAMCRPEPHAAPTLPPAAPHAQLITEAAAPKPNDDGEGDLSQSLEVARAQPDPPPDAGTELPATFTEPETVDVVETPVVKQSLTTAPVRSQPVRQPVYQRRRIGWRFGR